MPPWIPPTLTYTLLATALALTAFFILYGDRPKGRRRCRKCWYDAGDAPTPWTCPECGKPAKNERHLSRTRQRWKLATPLVLTCLTLAYAAHVTPAVQARGWWAAAPTPLLYANMDVDHLVYLLTLQSFPDAPPAPVSALDREALVRLSEGNATWSSLLIERVRRHDFDGRAVLLVRSSAIASVEPPPTLKAALEAADREVAAPSSFRSAKLLDHLEDPNLESAELILGDLIVSNNEFMSKPHYGWVTERGSIGHETVVAKSDSGWSVVVSDPATIADLERLLTE
ncbi:MAG: hypothetical protein CMJ31_13195 [Phycisphaerae bacterium]|nr:hypothetical protein [Phycisphaerae bacterium]